VVLAAERDTPDVEGKAVAHYHTNPPLAERLAPVLADLRDATGETVIFGKRVEDRAVYLDVLEGPHTVRCAARIGDFKRLHSSADVMAVAAPVAINDEMFACHAAALVAARQTLEAAG